MDFVYKLNELHKLNNVQTTALECFAMVILRDCNLTCRRKKSG